MKTKLIITRTISYQFQTLIQRIDTEFYRGSRGTVFKYFKQKSKYIYIYKGDAAAKPRPHPMIFVWDIYYF